VYIGSYYRRHVSDGESLEQLETSLHRASSIRNASVIIGGDFNLPGWDWRSTTLKPNATYPNLHQQFLDIINNNGLAQIIEDSTRKISVRFFRRFIISNLMESQSALLYKGMLRGFWRWMTGLKSNSE
jgi:hypothetical protein